MALEGTRDLGGSLDRRDGTHVTLRASQDGSGRPIWINQRHAEDPTGGRWVERDPVAHGKVQVLQVPDNRGISQARAALVELKRLSSLDPDWDWSTCAVIAREWSYLEPVRTVCDRDGIPAQMANEGNLSLRHLRETEASVNWVRRRGPGMLRTADVKDWLDRQPLGPWVELLWQARRSTTSRPPLPRCRRHPSSNG